MAACSMRFPRLARYRLTSVTVQDPMITDDPQPFGPGLIHGGVWDNARPPTPLLHSKTDHTLKRCGYSVYPLNAPAKSWGSLTGAGD